MGIPLEYEAGASGATQQERPHEGKGKGGGEKRGKGKGGKGKGGKGKGKGDRKVPCTLVRKRTLVEADLEGEHLPVRTFTFTSPEDAQARFDPMAVDLSVGEVVKVETDVKKPTSYSLSDKRADRREFDLTVKIYPGGRVSGLLDALQPGETVGMWKKPSWNVAQAGTHVGMIAFGVGITEVLPVAEAQLSNPEVRRVVVLWQSRSRQDTFSALKAKHGEQFKLVHALSREKAPGAMYGRVSVPMIHQVFLEPWGAAGADTASMRFLTVGTKEMMWGAEEMLWELGFPFPAHALITQGGW